MDCSASVGLYAGVAGAFGGGEEEGGGDVNAANDDTDVNAANGDTDAIADKDDTDVITANDDTDVNADNDDTDVNADNDDTDVNADNDDTSAIPGELGEVSSCPAPSSGPDCGGSVSNCWSPGQRDTGNL